MHDSFARFSGSTIAMIVLIAALGIVGSLAFACAVPLAAIAALAGLTMSRKTGLALVGTAWLSNQIVGFGFLHYPQTVDTVAWGAAIGISAIVAFLAVRAATGRLQGRSPIVTLPAAFFVAFAVYQLILFVTGYPLEGSEATLSRDVVARVFDVNLVAYTGLLLVQWAWSNFVRSADSASHA